MSWPMRAGLPAQPAGQPQVFAVMAAASMDLPDHWPENVFDWGAAYPLEPAHSDAAPLKRAVLEIAPETLKVWPRCGQQWASCLLGAAPTCWEPTHSDAAPLKRALLEIAPETLKVRVPKMCSTA